VKKNSENNFAPLSEEQLKNLTTTPKETIAAGFSQPKSFTTVDLWNIQRRSRTMMQRRSYF
jgi:hypothetical protein